MKVNYKEYRRAYRELETKVKNLTSRKMIQIEEMNETDGIIDRVIHVVLSWSGCGGCTLEEAQTFAMAMMEATILIKNFVYEGYEIEYED